MSCVDKPVSPPEYEVMKAWVGKPVKTQKTVQVPFTYKNGCCLETKLVTKTIEVETFQEKLVSVKVPKTYKVCSTEFSEEP